MFWNLAIVSGESLIAALYLFLLARILGEKQIAQLSAFDYIIGISIGSVPIEIVAHKDLSLVDGLLCMTIWALIPLLFSFLSIHSIIARVILDGSSTILIQDGRIIEKNLRKSRFTINDLLEEVRLKDVYNIQDVQYAILETNGKLSVLKKGSTQGDGTGATYHFPLIVDGQWVGSNIRQLGIDKEWIIRELEKSNIHTIRDVLIAEYDEDKQKMYTVKKEK